MDGCFLSTNFTTKYEMVFVKIQENASLDIGFIFKPIQSPYVPLKNGTRDFQNSPPFKGPARFYHRVFELSSGK